jgi:hypothetical protein
MNGFRIKVGNWISKERLTADEAVSKRRRLQGCLENVEIIVDEEG